MSPGFTSYLKRPIHTGDNTMLWPVFIIKLTVKGKVGSCLNISVWIQTKWHFLKYQGANAAKSNAKVSDYFSNLCPSQGSLPPWFICSHCLAQSNKSAPRNKFYMSYTKSHFLISHCLPDSFLAHSSGPPWATSATFVSQDWTWAWHSVPPFLNLHLQVITKSLLFLTPEVLKVQHLLPAMEREDAFWHH